jgi:hypothetical protein
MPLDTSNLVAPERNRYFYGLLMDAQRFQKDQDYFNHKRFLLNRCITGGGVVCGLALSFADGALTLSAGIAIDFAGREMIVPQATAVDITQVTDAQGNPTGAVPAGATIIVSLAYTERRIDPVAVLVPDCDHPDGCAPSTIAEGYALLVRVATGPAPAMPGCVFGSFPLPPGAALQSDIAARIAAGYSAPPSDPSVPLGRLTLPGGPLDAVSDRPAVYDNTLLYQLIVCLAGRVAGLAAVTLAYVSGDNQSASASAALAAPLVVALLDASGNPVIGAAPPQFTVAAGGGTLGAAGGAGPGQYQASWTLGPAGPQAVTVHSAQSAVTVRFTATIAP